MKFNVLCMSSLLVLGGYSSLQAAEIDTKAVSSTLTVNAGYDQVVPQQTKINMSATVNNQSVTYQWVQTAGPTVALKPAPPLLFLPP